MAQRISARRYVCCGSGGNKGVLYLGAFKALHKHFERTEGVDFAEYLGGVRGFAGVSIGALAALILLLQLDIDHVCDVLQPILCRMSDLLPRVNVRGFIEHYGLSDGSALRTMVADVLRLGRLHQDVTFRDLNRFFRCSYVCGATSLATGEPVYLSVDTVPDMRIVDAVYASMCVPFLFIPPEINGVRCVDGALSDRHPCVFPPDETLFFELDATMGCTGMHSVVDFANAVMSIRARADKNVVPTGLTVSLWLPQYMCHVCPLDMSVSLQSNEQRMHSGYAAALCALDPDVWECLLHITRVAVSSFASMRSEQLGTALLFAEAGC
jgi:predicted acylesterase/phospholipase RssA